MLRAIDISMHQPSIDLGKTDCDIVIMKATEGVGYTDPKLPQHHAGALAAGKPAGFYHFATGKAGAAAEADAFAAAVAGKTGVLFLDWEAGAVSKGPAYAKAWLDRVLAKTGRAPLIYMSESVTSAWDWSKVAPAYPLWLANYGTNKQQGWSEAPVRAPKHWGAAGTLIWQYTSKGRISGYSGNLDLNRVYLTAGQWAARAGGAAPAPSPTPAPPTPSPAAPVFPLPAGSYFGPKSGPAASVSGYYSHREDLRGWQQRMKDRGWSIAADGLYGPETQRVAVAFQKEKGLSPDGLIGVKTWAAAWTAPIT
ncbi:MAG: peptidoglycan-binding protein [Bifidobacteriaceae bacterium]|jgi:GH25 family lysozyme M1 (1,4-beta-N-acetylmuramidase)|nr:peptidoglycan-binding protein [Bifidobacteriaceae bacterium]